jgi:hypothetical protein
MSKNKIKDSSYKDYSKPLISTPDTEFDKSLHIRESFKRSTLYHKESVDPVYPLEQLLMQVDNKIVGSK